MTQGLPGANPVALSEASVTSCAGSRSVLRAVRAPIRHGALENEGSRFDERQGRRQEVVVDEGDRHDGLDFGELVGQVCEQLGRAHEVLLPNASWVVGDARRLLYLLAGRTSGTPGA